MKKYRLGIDYFRLNPGLNQNLHCKACESVMDVELNKKIKFGRYGQALMTPRIYDIYNCPNTGKRWHNHIVNLKGEIQKTISRKLQQIMEEEIQEILQDPTKFS